MFIPPGDLRLTSLLGAGRHGSVFLGSSDGEPVAVKVPLVHGHGDGHRGTACEGQALDRFDHPNIVTLRRQPLANGALVMEHCAGGTLADLLAERPNLEPTELHVILLPIIDALEHIHACGWIHGDIAPSNIAFRTDGTPLLIDFATARPADNATIVEGNPAFVGPLRAACPALDIRSLAATAVHSLGHRHRWDPEPDPCAELRSALQAIISRADGGRAVSLGELRTAIEESSVANPRGADPHGAAHPTAGSSSLALPRFRRGSGGSTRSFGPRPADHLSREHSSTRSADRRRVAAAAVLVGVVLIGLEILGSPGARPPEKGKPGAPVHEQITAAETLSAEGFTWDSSTGVLTRNRDGATTRWHIGAPGDHVALADWDCDGDATPGVYRPRTGSWFVFDDLGPDTTSAPPIRLDAGGALTVQLTTGGCAAPLVATD